MEQDVHAPSGPEGPAIDARGVAFTGSNLYVQLGRGRDYSWSATSSGQDIIDTFAVKLCEPGGGTPTRSSHYYVFNGQCLPMDELTHTNSWLPNVADQTPAGSETLQALRTKAGPRHRDGDDPRQAVRVHEAARDLQPRGRLGDLLRRLEQPRRGQGRQVVDEVRLQRSPHLQLVLHRQQARRLLQLRSANPVRGKNTHPNFPVLAKPKFMWKDYDADAEHLRQGPERQARPGRRPEVPDELEQQAGEGLPLRRHPLLLVGLSRRLARQEDQGGHSRQEEDEPDRADRRDGERRNDRPARARRPPLRAEDHRPRQGCREPGPESRRSRP